MDEIRIYNRALLDCEVAQLYNSVTISSRIGTTEDQTTNIYSTDVSTAIAFYPNPFTNTIDVIGDLSKSYRYELYTTEGTKIKAGLLNEKIDTATLLPGMYIIQVYDDQNKIIQTKRLIKV